jgi:5-methylcytosine-specific restriction endonuclease McrA
MRMQPLMPTTPTKAKKLLRQGKAKVIQRAPFTIQLLYATGETKQPITLGIDPGYKTIGFSAVTAKTELIAGEAPLRTDIPKLLKEKAMYRRQKRSRHHWYRQARFNNRKRTEKQLPPSLQQKLDSHIRLAQKLQRILPITKVIVEVAAFDTQKMMNTEISGVEYQQGTLQGYEIREYLLEKWGRKCAYCKKQNIPLEIEHIIPKSRGGTDSVNNLTLACHDCNQQKNNLTAAEFGYLEIQQQAQETLKQTPFMNVINARIKELLNCEITYGYVTKNNRIAQGLEKTHVNDAFTIAKGIEQQRSLTYIVTQRRRNNRALQVNRKGFKPSIRRKRHIFQSGDLVRYKKELCIVKGVFNYGIWAKLIDSKEKNFNSNVKNLRLIKYGKGLQFHAKQFSPNMNVGVFLQNLDKVKNCGNA